MPVLGLLSAIRIGELSQLYIVDIVRVDGIDAIRITNTGEGQSVKTAASLRTVPLHPILIETGFLDYVADVKRLYGNGARVFPYLRVDPINGFADVPSEFFSRYKSKKCGIDDKRKVFHSFRFTANDRLKQCGVGEEIRCQLLGHEYDSVNSATYSQKLNFGSLAAIVNEHLNFPAVDFSHIRYNPAVTAKLKSEMIRRAKYDAHEAAKAELGK